MRDSHPLVAGLGCGQISPLIVNWRTLELTSHKQDATVVTSENVTFGGKILKSWLGYINLSPSV